MVIMLKSDGKTYYKSHELLKAKSTIYIATSWQVLTLFPYQTSYDFRMADIGDSLILVENEYFTFNSRQSLKTMKIYLYWRH